MDNTMKEKCPQGVCSGEGEYITHGRKFNSLRGTRIHKARWCEERNSPAGECKSIDGHSHVGFTVQGMARKNITTIQRRGKIKQEQISEIVM